MESVEYLDQHPVDQKYSKKYKTGVTVALTKKILQEVEKIDYRSDKIGRLKEGIEATCAQLMLGTEIVVAKTDWTTSKYGLETKTLSQLLREDGKSEAAFQKETEVLLGMLKIAEVSGSKITTLNYGDLNHNVRFKR